MAESVPTPTSTMDAVPPAVRYRVREVVALLPATGALEGVAAERFSRLLDEGAPWLGADPALADIGMWMVAAARHPTTRARGCAWLACFPSAATSLKLAAIARDTATPPAVREQAIRTLGDRQVRALWPGTQWTTEALQVADETLFRLADAMTPDGKIASEQLPIALRGIQSEAAAAVIARAPGLWGEAIECFAPASLARVLYVSLDDIPAQHRLRAMRLVAATLVDDALPMLRRRAATGGLDEKLEALQLAIAVGGEEYVPALEDALKGITVGADMIRARAKWHLKNPGVVPTVRGLKVARATATLAVGDRPARCGQAADDFAALAQFARYPEAYVYGLWGWTVRGAGDPARASKLVSAHPESQKQVRDLYLEDLARHGRVRQLTAAAQALSGADLGAMWLALHGRPIAALELAATARLHTPELTVARALACYRAGRPDLTERILAEDLPPAEITSDDGLAQFPGADEQWRIERAPRPALTALASGTAAILALALPAPEGAEKDTASLEPIAAVVRRLGRGLPGSTVYLAGEFKTIDRVAVAAAIETAGARVVSGPFPGTDYYVHGDWCLVQTIAQLERQGARRLRLEELGL